MGNPHVKSCVELRKIILNPEYNMNPHSLELVCAAMRLENDLFYKEVEKEYDYMLSDRGFLDHLAYGDVNTSIEFTNKLFNSVIGAMTDVPDCILYFHVDEQETKRRRLKRNEPKDVIEAKGEEFQKKVAERFDYYTNALMWYLSKEGETELNMIEINANQSKEQVVQDVLKAIETLSQ